MPNSGKNDERNSAGALRTLRCFCLCTRCNGHVSGIISRMILIKDSLVVDGTGAPGKKSDILVRDGKILAIGSFPNHKADTVIEAMGLVTTPGFIDIDTDSDHYLSLFTDRPQHDFLFQGVTTIIGGHCGSSLAPLLRGSLNSIRKWGDVSKVNVDWQLLGEFLEIVERVKLGVNFGTLVGHSTIRRALLGEALRDLTVKEMAAMKEILEQAMDEGAFGLSTGLAYNHSKNTPYGEVRELVETVKKYKGIYATHIRDEREDVVNAVNEAISISRETGVTTIVSHFRAIKGYVDGFKKGLEAIEGASKDGIEIYFDGYPFDYSMLPIYLLLPDAVRHGSLEEMQKVVSGASASEEIFKSFGKINGHDLIIARAPGFDYLVGKDVAEFARSHELDFKDALLKLMKVTKLKAVLFVKNIDFAATKNALLSEQALIASNSPSLVEDKNIIENERAAETFTRFYDFALESGKPVEWVIEKFTHRPAKVLGLKNRGVIKEGNIADLAILDNGRAVHVIVGGEVAVLNRSFQEVYNGEVLRRGK